MSTIVSWNGSSYTVPATGEENWGGVTKVDGLLVSLATNGFQKTGGLFTLSADADFGASAGLKSLYYKSRGTVATAGIIRLAKAEGVAWLNNAGSGNNTLTTDNSDNITYNGVILASSSGVVPVASGGTGLTSYTAGDMIYASAGTTLAKLAIGSANKVLTTNGSVPSWNTIVNANVDAAAAIAYSKLNLAVSILNADVAVGAAIAYSKLALTGSIVNADVAAGAAVAYSKLATLNTGQILVGNAGVPTATTLGGDATIGATGTLTLGAKSVQASKLDSGVSTSGFVATADGSGGVSYAAVPSAPTFPEEDYNLGLLVSVAANALTIALKQADGSTDPSTGSAAVKLAFRSATATTGSHTERSVTAALSVVVPSGTTIGTANGVATYLYVYAIDNAGTVVLGVSMKLFDEGAVQSSSAISGGASATTLYSTSAQTSKAIRLIGRINISEATAGTWGTAPTEVAVGNRFRFNFAPTVQTFLTSSSGTYTTPSNPKPKWIQVIMVGGGGGGGGSTANAGGNGTDTTFGGATAGLGTGGGTNGGDGGNGGTATLGSGMIGMAVSGGKGMGGANRGSLTENLIGGSGGNNPMGGAGQGQQSTAGSAGAANTGGGGGGGSQGSALVGGGGGAGGYINAIIVNPADSYSYVVGNKGTGGAAGGQAGGDGGLGGIWVYEFY
jgi:hypothetical protein